MSNDLNQDPITGEIGSHPVGTGVGGVGGAALGATIGAIGGPLGALIGGAIGAVVGGKAGHEVAEKIDPTLEDTYWQENYIHAPYYNSAYSYEDYQPAYAVGYANRHRYETTTHFEDIEADLERSWNEVKGKSRLMWSEARQAVRDAWYRIVPDNR